MTTTELIIRGSILGILLFAFCRWLYHHAYIKGARHGAHLVLEELKKNHEKKNPSPHR